MLETPIKLACKLLLLSCKGLPQIDINCIRAAKFYQSVKQEGSITFVTSLYKIDCLIKEKQYLMFPLPGKGDIKLVC